SAPALFFMGNSGGNLRLRAANLLRLLRLHRHCNWLGAAFGIQASRKLQCAISRPERRRLLAALAHHAVRLAARLCLCVVWRPSKAPLQSLSQRRVDHVDRRPLAWRGLDIPVVGRVAWTRSLGKS